jgi:P4 family phage/plasmid primase-like protien
MPKTDDFKNFTNEQIKERQKLVNATSHIAIDTSKIHHVDYDEYGKVPEVIQNLIDNYPYFKSSTKSFGKHIFIKGETLISSYYKFKYGEVLTGTWAFCPKDFVVYNHDKNMEYDLDLLPPKSENEKPKSPRNVTENEKPKSSKLVIKNEEIMEMHLDLFIEKCYSVERAFEYSTWYQMVFAIIGSIKCNEKIKYFAHKFSKLANEKYDYNGVENIVNKIKYTRFTPRSLYYWAKEDNLVEYQKIMKEFPLLSVDNFNEGQLSNLFHKLNLNNYIWCPVEEKYFSWNGKKWEKEQESLISNIQKGEFYDLIKMSLFDCISPESEKFKEIGKSLKMLGRRNTAEAIAKSCRNDFKKKIEFDTDQNLLGFENGVIDLRTCEFREYQKSDFLTMSCGYDWREPTTEEQEKLDKIINSIMPTDDIKNFMMQLYATCLYGKCLQNFIQLTGCGGNGKGIMQGVMKLVLGDYFYTGMASILTKDVTSGATPEFANLAKKRMVVFAEPDKSTRLNNATLKILTGGDAIVGRLMRENKTEHANHLTLFLECNERPNLGTDINEAIVRRFVDVELPNKFTTKEHEWDYKTTFPADTNLKDNLDGQLDGLTIKFAMLRKLLDFIKNYKGDLFSPVMPESMRLRAEAHLLQSCVFMNWFLENYEYDESSNRPIKFADLYSCFSMSDDYKSLSSKEKSFYKRSKCLDIIKKEEKTKKSFRDLYQPKINGIQEKFRSCILNWKLRENDDDCIICDDLDF